MRKNIAVCAKENCMRGHAHVRFKREWLSIGIAKEKFQVRIMPRAQRGV